MTHGVDGDHLAGTKSARLNDLRLVQLNQPDLGSHHDQSAAGHLIASGTQTVTVHGRRGDLAVGEGHRRWAVPRLGQAGVVFVEPAKFRVHVVVLFPSLGNQHHHRVQHAPTRGHEQLERLVERLRVGTHRPQHRMQLRNGSAPHVRLQCRTTRPHPMLVAEERIDLAVMCDVAERLGNPPVGQRVGRVALMEQRQRRDGLGVCQIGIEAAQLRSHHQALVDDSRVGHRNDVRLAGRIVRIRFAQRTILRVGTATRQIHAAPILVVRDSRWPCKQHLLNARQLTERPATEHGRIGRYDTPSDDIQPGSLRSRFENESATLGRVLVHRQEDHGQAEIDIAEIRPSQTRQVVSQDRIGNADRDSSAIPRIRIGVDGATMGQADDASNGLLDEFVCRDPVKTSDESCTATITETLRIVESGVVGRRCSVGVLGACHIVYVYRFADIDCRSQCE